MIIGIKLIINSALLGIGLAMDAFSVSLANGLAEPQMKSSRMFSIAGTFAVFQCAMPLIGWFCVHTIAEKFTAFQKFIPWIALILLLYIGGKMLLEGIHELRANHTEGVIDTKVEQTTLTLATLMLQGVATSIDALSVGFTISDYQATAALLASIIIGVVTLIICLFGLKLGKTFGTKLAGRANILGGAILVFIGLEIWITGVFL